jgi:hypothetical protein
MGMIQPFPKMIYWRLEISYKATSTLILPGGVFLTEEGRFSERFTNVAPLCVVMVQPAIVVVDRGCAGISPLRKREYQLANDFVIGTLVRMGCPLLC